MSLHRNQPDIATRIVATIGPATEAPERIADLLRAGVNVFRLNFSHGDHGGHRAVYKAIRQEAGRLGRPAAILQDLQGPKIRVGEMAGEAGALLEDGAEFRICTKPILGTAQRASTAFTELARDVEPGHRILLNDGNIELAVLAIERDTPFGDEIVTRVLHGGPLTSNKGINLPGTVLNVPALTEKDLEDLAFGIELGVDLIALSFVRNRADVEVAQQRIRDLGGTQPLIAKVEKPEAVKNLEEIVDAADGIMVARGDLGVELSVEQVPGVQKRLIRMCNEAGKPVITATQMLESMIQNPRPTRAEASDIANAILDGTDAVMLSGETAMGDFPIKAVDTMVQIARRIEVEFPATFAPLPGKRGERDFTQRAVASAAKTLAQQIGAKAIGVLTESGLTARCVSRTRPGVPIVAFTGNASLANRLALWRGIDPVVADISAPTDETIAMIVRHMADQAIAFRGDSIVIVGARPGTGQELSVFLEVHTLA